MNCNVGEGGHSIVVVISFVLMPLSGLAIATVRGFAKKRVLDPMSCFSE